MKVPFRLVMRPCLSMIKIIKLLFIHICVSGLVFVLLTDEFEKSVFPAFDY